MGRWHHSPWDPMDLPTEIQSRHICPEGKELTDSLAIGIHQDSLLHDSKQDLNIVLDGSGGFKGVKSGNEGILCYTNKAPAKAIVTRRLGLKENRVRSKGKMSKMYRV